SAIARGAVEHAPSPHERAEALLRLGIVLMETADIAEAIASFEAGLAEEFDDDVLRAELLEQLAWNIEFRAPAGEESRRLAKRAVEAAERSGNEVALAKTLATRAEVEARLGHGVQRALLDRAIDLEAG